MGGGDKDRTTIILNNPNQPAYGISQSFGNALPTYKKPYPQPYQQPFPQPYPQQPY